MKKYLLILLLSIFCINCSQQVEKETSKHTSEVLSQFDIPVQTIDKSKLTYNRKTSLWTLNEESFSGYAMSTYSDGTLKQKFGISEGKKQHEASEWYPDGHLKYLTHYHQGKLHGVKKSWNSDSSHILISHLNYHLGKAHGEQKKWYPTGEIFKILNLNMGKEEGIQQAFRKNGALFANYEAREGRIFGLKRASLCYELNDEEVQFVEE